jgi:hypothetical protein
MKWITREKVKVDRVACPWLIKKFVDPDAEFVFLPHDTEVSFDAILRKHGLTNDPGLILLAQIVRAADSRPTDPHPAGEGLRWIAHGFSALGLSDHEILDREFIVYDALYAECQKRVAA